MEDFNAAPEVNSATLKVAISETMTGVEPDNIQNLEVTAGSAAAVALKRAKSLRNFARALTTTTGTIVVTYDVVLLATATTMTAEDLQAQLIASVSDGSFNTILQVAAADSGAANLQSASSESIVTQTTTPDSTTDSSTDGSDKHTMSGANIAGTVIGSFIGLVLVAMLMYYLLLGNVSAPTRIAVDDEKYSVGASIEEV